MSSNSAEEIKRLIHFSSPSFDMEYDPYGKCEVREFCFESIMDGLSLTPKRKEEFFEMRDNPDSINQALVITFFSRDLNWLGIENTYLSHLMKAIEDGEQQFMDCVVVFLASLEHFKYESKKNIDIHFRSGKAFLVEISFDIFTPRVNITFCFPTEVDSLLYFGFDSRPHKQAEIVTCLHELGHAIYKLLIGRGDFIRYDKCHDPFMRDMLMFDFFKVRRSLKTKMNAQQTERSLVIDEYGVWSNNLEIFQILGFLAIPHGRKRYIVVNKLGDYPTYKSLEKEPRFGHGDYCGINGIVTTNDYNSKNAKKELRRFEDIITALPIEEKDNPWYGELYEIFRFKSSDKRLPLRENSITYRLERLKCLCDYLHYETSASVDE